MNPLGLYEPGNSPLHRAPAGPKVAVMLLVAAVAVAMNEVVVLAGMCAAVAAGYALARVPARRLWSLVRVLLPLVAVVVAVQLWFRGPQPALVFGLRLVAAVGVANLVTLTTRVDALVGAVERGLGPLRRLGVRPERVGLVVGLTVAAVGTLSGVAAEVREAARARGADRSITAFAVPFLVRTLRHADELGEALAARGAADPPPPPRGRA